MADVTFIDGDTRVESSWLNGINSLKYDIFDGAETKQEACEAIGAIRVEGTPDTDDVPTWNGSVWVPAPVSGGGPVVIPNPLIVEGTTVGNDHPELHLIYSNTQEGCCLRFISGVLQLHYIVGGVVETDPLYSFNLYPPTGAVAYGASSDWTVDPT